LSQRISVGLYRLNLAEENRRAKAKAKAEAEAEEEAEAEAEAETEREAEAEAGAGAGAGAEADKEAEAEVITCCVVRAGSIAAGNQKLFCLREEVGATISNNFGEILLPN
jgi:regulator of protease activity HflC (stomatin/prohibitin superfamily)